MHYIKKNHKNSQALLESRLFLQSLNFEGNF